MSTLPEPYMTTVRRDLEHTRVNLYSEEQMRAYASAALAAAQPFNADAPGQGQSKDATSGATPEPGGVGTISAQPAQAQERKP